ncbi:lactoylglutathione lyase GLX1-like isoform X2 [Cicer arietinum]|uniref:lactoylglutathione lyase n=1 Tax=Cicer arietinum TaxID=3827 RepID=A0A1S2Y8M1_CICAR|nr:lactoylglutathione lyase GLX1-like isoform X2 [Cicer arietinum]
MKSSLTLPSYSLRTCCCITTQSSSSRRLSLFHLLTTTGAIAVALPQSQSLFAAAKGSDLFKISQAIAAVDPSQPNQNLFHWIQNDNRRFLHVVYSVGDLDKTIKFYTECLGMKLLRKRDLPEDKYSNAFLGYGPEDSHFTVELTYNYGVDNYDVGTGFGHFGIVTQDVAKTIDLVKAKEGKVTREPQPVKSGSMVTASIEDPNGYRFELLERRPTREPLNQVMLRVGDLDRAIDFYQKAVGMKLLYKIDNPEEKYTVAILGYDSEANSPVLKLTYNYGVTNYDKGNGYTQIAIGTNDVYKTAEAIKLCGGTIIREPGPLPGINTKIVVCLDPDGWKLVFVDNVDFLKELE